MEIPHFWFLSSSSVIAIHWCLLCELRFSREELFVSTPACVNFHPVQPYRRWYKSNVAKPLYCDTCGGAANNTNVHFIAEPRKSLDCASLLRCCYHLDNSTASLKPPTEAWQEWACLFYITNLQCCSYHAADISCIRIFWSCRSIEMVLNVSKESCTAALKANVKAVFIVRAAKKQHFDALSQCLNA